MGLLCCNSLSVAGKAELKKRTLVFTIIGVVWLLQLNG
jgi:hypothetical protein